LWLVYGYKYSDPWDIFVAAYQWKNIDEQVRLNQNIYAFADVALSFGNPVETSRQNITIDGNFFVVNSSGFANKGFIIENSSLTFMDIVFTSFVRAGGLPSAPTIDGAGGVMNISNSSVIFRGSIKWIKNAAQSRGGYLSGVRDIGEWYREKLRKTTTSVIYKGKPIENFLENDEALRYAFRHLQEQRLDISETKALLREFIQDEQESINANPTKDNKRKIEDLKLFADALNKLNFIEIEEMREKGQLYEVEIPDSEDFLQWNKDFSEQSEKVRAALRKVYEDLSKIKVKPDGIKILIAEGDEQASLDRIVQEFKDIIQGLNDAEGAPFAS
jgi:Arc/MetJ-type ribon-helix-helix transcriptional regulator